MSAPSKWRLSQKQIARLVVALVAVCAAVAAGVFHDRWLPVAKRVYVAATQAIAEPDAEQTDEHGAHEGDDHAGHDHAGHDEANSLELSPQARKNIGLEVGSVRLQTFERSITAPGIVAERAAWTHVIIAAPITGVVTDVFVTEGQAVQSGQLLFIVRLTHEDVVQSQTEFLKTLEALDVEKRELARLKSVGASVVAGKTVLEREYQKQKLEGQMRAQREALLLHGLNENQIKTIVDNRRLLKELRVEMPNVHDEHADDHLEAHHNGDVKIGASPSASDDALYVVESLDVYKGQAVVAGDELARMGDLAELYIEGQAFEQDIALVHRAAENDWDVSAEFQGSDGETFRLEDLKLVYVANLIDLSSRALRFYVALPNEQVPVGEGAGDKRFMVWRFKPGQRLTLHVPVERLENKIVLPADAVVQEGAEHYVFVQNGGHFDRQPVHVVHQTRDSVVIANDGALFPGQYVALSGAYQMQLALKNKAGGAVDPHAGHSH